MQESKKEEQVDPRYRIIEGWYTKAPIWQRYVFNKLLTEKNINLHEIIDDIVSKLKSKTPINDQPIALSTVPNIIKEKEKNSFLLKKISKVAGVAALSYDCELEFGPQMNIIYGANGSGKSSYVNLLKNILSSKGEIDILDNVFNPSNKTPYAHIECSLSSKEVSLDWKSGYTHHMFPPVSIFDSMSPKIYINSKNSLLFEPELLYIFSQLANICDGVAKRVRAEQRICQDSLITVPSNFKAEKLYNSYDSIKDEQDIQEFRKIIKWNDEDTQNFKDVNNALNSPDKKRSFESFINARNSLRDVYTVITKLAEQFNDEHVIEYYSILEKRNYTVKAANEDADKVFSNSHLDGIGTESWKQLWQAARTYSENYAYKDKVYPNTQKGAVCVLCHQPLSNDAVERLNKFESFIRSNLQANVQVICNEVESIKSTFIKEDGKQALSKFFANQQYFDCQLVKDIEQAVHKLNDRKQYLLSEKEKENIPSAIDIQKIQNQIKVTGDSLNQQIKFLKEAIDNEEKLVSTKKSLEAKQWFSVHANNLDVRLNMLNLEKILRQTNTRAVSIAKAKISQEVITPEYVAEFQQNITSLGAGNIKVELETTTSKGELFHSIGLKDAKIRNTPLTVLSDGEAMIVSLAAFLSEITLFPINLPLILDDPVSSLDQQFEENVAKRLFDLSSTHQVIVFTHRLSMLQLLQENCEVAGVYDLNLIALRKKPIGDPHGDLPIKSFKMKSATNKFLDEIVRLRKLAASKKFEDYDRGIDALQSNIRIMIENSIEHTLLHNVVNRYKKSVQTQQIKYLSKITLDDIKLFQGWMTDYSYPEHSQPFEAPIESFPLDKIERDLHIMHDWAVEFDKRETRLKA